MPLLIFGFFEGFLTQVFLDLKRGSIEASIFLSLRGSIGRFLKVKVKLFLLLKQHNSLSFAGVIKQTKARSVSDRIGEVLIFRCITVNFFQNYFCSKMPKGMTRVNVKWFLECDANGDLMSEYCRLISNEIYKVGYTWRKKLLASPTKARVKLSNTVL